MYVEKETEKAFLMNRDAVPFWIQKRWLVRKGGGMELTKAGWKAYHMAAREHWKRFGYDAEKEFEAVRRTEKAVLLRCAVELPDGGTEAAEFWLPRAVTGNWEFVARKIKEIEAGFPFNGMRVVRRPPRAGRAASPGAGGKL